MLRCCSVLESLAFRAGGTRAEHGRRLEASQKSTVVRLSRQVLMIAAVPFALTLRREFLRYSTVINTRNSCLWAYIVVSSLTSEDDHVNAPDDAPEPPDEHERDGEELRDADPRVHAARRTLHVVLAVEARSAAQEDGETAKHRS